MLPLNIVEKATFKNFLNGNYLYFFFINCFALEVCTVYALIYFYFLVLAPNYKVMTKMKLKDQIINSNTNFLWHLNEDFLKIKIFKQNCIFTS